MKPWKIKAYVKRRAHADGGYTATIHIKARPNFFSAEYWYMRKVLRELDHKALVKALHPPRHQPLEEPEPEEDQS